MNIILPTTPADHPDRMEMLVEAVVLPAQKAMAVVGRIRAMFQMLQDLAWETAITSVEGVLALGAFNLLVSFSLAMLVAPAVRQASIMQSMSMLKSTGVRYYGASRDFVFGPEALLAQLPAGSTSRGNT